MPDERLRAAATQFRDTWMRAGAVRVNDSRSSEITMLVDFARLREDSAMREAAGLVCDICKMGLHELKKIDGKWEHLLNHCDHKVECAAGPIHERLALKEK